MNSIPPINKTVIDPQNPYYGFFYGSDMLPEIEETPGQSAIEKFVLKVAETFVDFDKELDSLMEGDWDEPYLERCIRDLKADYFDRLNQVVVDSIEIVN